MKWKKKKGEIEVNKWNKSQNQEWKENKGYENGMFMKLLKMLT